MCRIEMGVCVCVFSQPATHTLVLAALGLAEAFCGARCHLAPRSPRPSSRRRTVPGLRAEAEPCPGSLGLRSSPPHEQATSTGR